jgi:ABC-type transporter Mla maintaining outer membrane lipid asymmetry ATPase subunit MlaF
MGEEVRPQQGKAPEKNDQDVVIVVDHLTARFGDNLVFKDVNFEVRRGEILVILGGSGCGKSTLLKHMIGLYSPAEGKVLINGIDIQNDETGRAGPGPGPGPRDRVLR